MQNLSAAIPVVTLIVTGLTFWILHLRKGVVKGTKPAKISLKTTNTRRRGFTVSINFSIYSTAKAGRIISQVTADIQKGQTKQLLPIWMVGDTEKNEGSGMRVTSSDLSACHHFHCNDGENWRFTAGEYLLSIYASVEGSRKPTLIRDEIIVITDQQAAQLEGGNQEITFRWDDRKSNFCL